MAYRSHIFRQNANSPVPMEVYPSLAFDSLFENQGSRRTLSILDSVREHTEALNRRVSRSDRAKLDEYLTSVREVERRGPRPPPPKERAGQRARGPHPPPRALRPPPHRPPPEPPPPTTPLRPL